MLRQFLGFVLNNLATAAEVRRSKLTAYITMLHACVVQITQELTRSNFNVKHTVDE